jgi:hypothetical protein
MQHSYRGFLSGLLALVFLPAIGFAQAQPQSENLIVNGKSGKAQMIQQGGRTYVDAEALARIANGSLSFSDSGIALTIPSAGASTTATSETSQPADPTALSRGFMKAAIEQMALLREWGAAMAYAADNGYPIQAAWAANYQQKAQQGTSMAGVAATTPGDKDAQTLLTNEYQGVRDWSNQLVEASKNMSTAKYSMNPGSLKNEPQSQKLIACWQFLSSMLSGGSFQDDGSCH